MLININEIKINEGRRAAKPENIQVVADSIRDIGLLNAITVTADHTLIAGLHRLEAAKMLGWTEIECTVINAEGLQAKLMEIDENYARTNLTQLESSELMLQRKEAYEALHPETKAGAAQAAALNRDSDVEDNLSATPPVKSFAEDTAEKLGVDARTVRRQVQIAKDLTPETKEMLKVSGVKVTQRNLSKLAKLDAEQQKDAAGQLIEGKIKSVDEYTGTASSRGTKEKSAPENGEQFVLAFAQLTDTFLSDLDRFDELDAGTLRLEREQIVDIGQRTDAVIERIRSLVEHIVLKTAMIEYGRTENS